MLIERWKKKREPRNGFPLFAERTSSSRLRRHHCHLANLPSHALHELLGIGMVRTPFAYSARDVLTIRNTGSAALFGKRPEHENIGGAGRARGRLPCTQHREPNMRPEWAEGWNVFVRQLLFVRWPDMGFARLLVIQRGVSGDRRASKSFAPNRRFSASNMASRGGGHRSHLSRCKQRHAGSG